MTRHHESPRAAARRMALDRKAERIYKESRSRLADIEAEMDFDLYPANGGDMVPTYSAVLDQWESTTIAGDICPALINRWKLPK